MLVDTHCHLDFPGLEERLDEVLSNAQEAGVTRMVTISTHVARFDTYRALAERDARIFFTIGTHPHQAAQEPDTRAQTLIALSQHPRCIAIGEAGLDYHYNKSPREVQRKVFRTHIHAARETGLPLIIHARDADEDMIDILREEMGQGAFKGILHCFSSTLRLAQVGVELGLYVSFSGILTFKKSDELRRLAAQVPHEKLLVETDAPYLAPEPYRGKTNEPAYTRFTAKVLGKTLGMNEEKIAELTTRNFYTLFGKAAALDGISP